MIRRANGSWELAVAPDQLEVPALVQGILQARLDRLDHPARETIAVAAVIGRRFGMPLLERVVDPETLPGALSELQRLELIFEERRRPYPEYRFRHGLVQEAAYAGLTEADRQALHGRVGRALEELAGDDPSPSIYALLASHFTAADDAAKAVEYLLRAGDAARANYADQEAIRHYRRAREFLGRLGDDRRSRETLFKIALVHHLAFDFAQAESAYDEAFACKVEPFEQPAPTERLVTALLRPNTLAPGPRVHLRDERAHGPPLPRPADRRPRPERDAVAGRELPRLERRARRTCSSSVRGRAGATASPSPPTTSSTRGSARGSARR